MDVADDFDELEGIELEPVDAGMEPPPVASYTSEAELRVAVKAWSIEHGYGLVVSSSGKRPGSAVRNYVMLRCDRGGKASLSSYMCLLMSYLVTGEL